MSGGIGVYKKETVWHTFPQGIGGRNFMLKSPAAKSGMHKNTILAEKAILLQNRSVARRAGGASRGALDEKCMTTEIRRIAPSSI